MYEISTRPNHFKGVYPCDIFLDKVNKKELLLKEKNCFIINLSSSNHRGSHFVCLLVKPRKVVEYFDSFGLPLFDINIKKALTSFKVEMFDETLQDMSSEFCGLYCSKLQSQSNLHNLLHYVKNIHFFLVSYLLWRQLGLKKKQYTALFNTEKKDGNDATVLKLIEIFAEERKS